MTAQVTQPAVGLPDRWSTVAAARPRHPAAAAAPSHSGVAAVAPAGVRVTRASSDWFTREPSSSLVKLPECRKYPVSHHLADSSGSAANPMRTVPASAAVATAACRSFPARSRYRMKIIGTSLIPAATPTPAPFQRRRSGWQRSQAMSAISISSIWPCCSETRTGTVQIPTAPTPSTPAQRYIGPQPSWPNVTQRVSTTAVKLAAAISQVSSAQGSSEPTANPSAANGV